MAAAAIAAGAAGCARYQLDFVREERTDPAGGSRVQPVHIDIVAVGSADLRRDPEMARCTAGRWFAYKREQGGYPMVPPEQVTSIDLPPDMAEVVRVSCVHHDSQARGAALFVFADFEGGPSDLLLAPHQYRIAPIDPGGGELTVKIAEARLEVSPGEYHGPKPIVKR
jgi:hypothetical protein